MATGKPLQPGVVVSVVGPTASGKTEFAIAIGQALSTEIVNADARQVYQHMAIGTAQPTREECEEVRHHLVNFLPPNELYSAGAFEEDAVPLLSNLCSEHGTAILAGGSGMYVKAALRGLDALPADTTLRAQLNTRLASEGLHTLVEQLQTLDPVHAAAMDTSNPQRVVRALEVCMVSGKPFSSFHSGTTKPRPWHAVSIGLDPDRTELRARIAERAQRMMDAGWLDETKALLSHRSDNALNTVGYKELFQHLDGTMPLDQAVELVITRTRQFAKRQMTWFKKDPKTTWFPHDRNTRDEVLQRALAHAMSEVKRLQGTPLRP